MIGNRGFTQLPGGEFKAQWLPALRPSLLSRGLDIIMWPSPILFLLAIIIVRNTWVSLICFFLCMRLAGNQLHLVVSKIIFPGTLIGKDPKDFGWLHRTLLIPLSKAVWLVSLVGRCFAKESSD